MAVSLLIVQTRVSIAFGLNNQILKLQNQNYPWKYLSEHYCCGVLDSTLVEVTFKICISVYRRIMLPPSNL